VLFDGEVVNHRDRPSATIAMVFQNYALYPQYERLRQHGHGLRKPAHAGRGDRRRVREAAACLQIADYLDRSRVSFSGQRQRVAWVARWCAGRGHFCSTSRFRTSRQAARLHAGSRFAAAAFVRHTSIYVTHDQLEAMTLATCWWS